MRKIVANQLISSNPSEGITKIYSNISNISRNKWIKAKFFNRNTKLRQLAFISLDHITMRLPNLLQTSLNLPNSITLQILNLLQRTPNNPQRLRVNPGSRQQLINLRILSLQTLLNSFMFLFKN